MHMVTLCALVGNGVIVIFLSFVGREGGREGGAGVCQAVPSLWFGSWVIKIFGCSGVFPFLYLVIYLNFPERRVLVRQVSLMQ